ncbi:MAG: Ig-like domain-containing protein [Candidatus Magasanikbacteria bacterium]
MLKKTFFTFVILSLLAINFAWIGTAKADPAPYFSLIATEGQGVGSNEFYVGRCFRVNIYLNTGGSNTNGADVEINYNSSTLQAVQSNCSSAATTVYTDGIFDVYLGAGNDISSSKILLSAYNNPGTSTNVSNGLYGHLFFKVLTASSSYDLNFEYTQDLTTDTNLAQTGGDGSDILLSVENLNLSLIEDNDNPVIDTQSPASGATGVAVNSTISFRLYDAMAGIDSSSVTSRMKEGSGTYYSQSVSVGSSLSTNQTRYYQYTGSYNPNSNIKTNGGYYEYATSYTVEAVTNDLGSASTHSTTSVWSFTTEDDTNAPYTSNFSPTDGSSGVAVDSNVSFRVKDYKSNGGVIPGLGVDEDAIAVVVSSDSLGMLNYTCSSGIVTCDVSNPNSVLVTINPASDFAENEAVSVDIGASDLHSSANAMTTSSYSFTTEDTAPPTISGFTPTANSTGSASSTNISFHIVDGGSGVAIEYLDVYVNNDNYTAISSEVTVTGDASDYLIVIDPVSNFTVDQAVVVRISVQDQASTPNVISPNPTLYNFIVGLESTTPTCPTCGGGGGIMYIEKECPEVQCEQCEEYEEATLSCPVAEDLICPEVQNGVGSCPVCPATDSIDQEDGLLVQDVWLPTKINLETINDKKLSDKKFLSIFDTEKILKFGGVTDAKEGAFLPVLFFKKGAKASDIALYVKTDKQGRFAIDMQNIFTTGVYSIKSSLFDDLGKEKEVEIGSFEIKETFFIPLRTEDQQAKIDQRFNIAGILVFLFIVLISIIVLFATRSMVGGLGFATTFLLAIFGMVLIVMHSNNSAIIVKEAKSGFEVDESGLTQEKYQELAEGARKEYETFNAQLVDPIIGKTITGAVIEVGDQISVTDELGVFTLQNVASTDRIKITHAGFSQPLYLLVGEIVDNQIGVNTKLMETLVRIQKGQQQRQFKSVYPYASSDVQEQIGQDLFVKAQNQSLLDRIKQFKMADSGFATTINILDTWKSASLGKTYQNVAKVNYTYSGYNDNQGLVKLNEPWYFIEEEGEWRFLK